MRLRPVWAEVDLAAVRHNTAVLAALAAPAQVCAVVKAYAYGHGPVRAAESALAGGATCLAVALVEEGVALRHAGITEPVLILSEPPPSTMPEVIALDLTPTLYTAGGVETSAKAVATYDPGGEPLTVQVKVDTGMHRVGAAPEDAVALAVEVSRRPELELGGFWTHLAVADEPDNPFTAEQVARFQKAVADLAAESVRPPVLHVCNSAGLLTGAPCYDLVRCGIALYGLAPSAELIGWADLRPALSLKARVSYVKEVAAGEGVSYGLRYRCREPTVLATVPIGYADGVPRRLGHVGGEVLIRGRRRPIAGTVTMDQITVDCGDDRSVEVGDEVVLLGEQGGERIGAWDWAAALDTIAYEVVCGISSRVPREYVG